MQIDPFYVSILLLFLAGLLIAGRHALDERRWRREREASDAAQNTAAE